MKNYNELASDIHEAAIAQGFYETPPADGTLIMLIILELSEALEANRKGKDAHVALFENYQRDILSKISHDQAFAMAFELLIKDTRADELADTFIRILDYCAYKQINIEVAINNVVDRPTEALVELYRNESFGSILLHICQRLTVCTINGTYSPHELACSIHWIEALCMALNIDLQRHVVLKMRYNQSRPYKHGKKY